MAYIWCLRFILGMFFLNLLKQSNQSVFLLFMLPNIYLILFGCIYVACYFYVCRFLSTQKFISPFIIFCKGGLMLGSLDLQNLKDASESSKNHFNFILCWSYRVFMMLLMVPFFLLRLCFLLDPSF